MLLTCACDLKFKIAFSSCESISKIYQENIRGTLKELLEKFDNKNIKGEFVIVIDGKKN